MHDAVSDDEGDDDDDDGFTKLFLLSLALNEYHKSTLRRYDEEDEKRAVEAIAAATKAEVNQSRSTARAQHNGHGIFSETWVNGSGGGDDDEVLEGEEVKKEIASDGAAAAEEDGAAATCTPKPVKRFKPIGAATPVVEFRWKTAEEEEAEELVADLVANAIANVIAAAAEGSEEQSMEF